MFGAQRPSYRQYVDLDDAGQLELREDEQLILVQKTELAFGTTPSDSLGEGLTFVTSERVAWVGARRSVDYDMAYIGLHAVTHDPTSFPRPCLYCQFDEEDEGSQLECFFIPCLAADSAPESFEFALRTLFDAFSKAACMNPDEEDDGSEELFYNADEVQQGALDVLAPEQAAALDHLESVFQEPAPDIV